MRAASFVRSESAIRAWVVAGALALTLVSACDNTRDAGASCSPHCTGTQMCCAIGSGTTGACINHLIDPRNCGECGNTCLTGQSCINGSCLGMPTDGSLPDSGVRPDSGGGSCTASPSCAAGFMCCGPRCIDADGIPMGDGRADMSFNDCGVCGVMCDETSASRCGRPRGATSGRPVCLCGDFTACTAPRECINSGGTFRCIDPLGDDTACGADAVNCTLNNEMCEAGVCTCPATGASCAPLLCGASACVDTDTDEMNCGAPMHACAAGETCNGGVCGCGTGGPCAGPSGFPPTMCGSTCCADHCVPVGITNCGGCGVTCTGTELCMTGILMPGISCQDPDTALFSIECDEPPPGPDAGPPPVDAAVDVDAASDPDAGVDAG
jgi:hypothetical protein